MSLGRAEALVLSCIFETAVDELGTLLSSAECSQRRTEAKLIRTSEHEDKTGFYKRAAKILENYGTTESKSTDKQKYSLLIFLLSIFLLTKDPVRVVF